MNEYSYILCFYILSFIKEHRLIFMFALNRQKHATPTRAMYKAPWWWILCDSKHVGALL